MQPVRPVPKVIELASFDALHRWLSAWTAADPSHPTEPALAEVFYTLPWFENLALHGIAGSAQDGTRLILLTQTESSGTSDAPGSLDRASPVVCLPLLSGKRLSALGNYYSSLYGPVVWQHAAPAGWRALATHLRQHPARWPVVTLSPLDTDAPPYDALHRALSQAGYWVDTFFCFGNWYLRVEQRRFEDYFSGLPSALRNSIERGQRRLTKQGPWSIHIQQAPDDALESAIAAFVHIYNQSWKSPEPHADFIPNLARLAAHQGWLRLGVLTFNGQAIAAQLWLVKDQKASIYKLAYVQGFEKFSAGSVLTHAMMRHAMDADHVQEVDYLTGDDAYKRDWMSHRRERRGIVAFHPGTLEGVARAAQHWAGKWLKLRPQLPT